MIELLQKHIEKLDGNTLPLLLNKLLTAECSAYRIPLNSTHLTLADRICVADGGADAIVTIHSPIDTDFLFSTNMIFQVKATSVSSLSTEISKENIGEHIKSGGAYILFCNKLHCEGYNTLCKENELKKQIADTLKLPENEVNFRLYDHSQIATWVEKYYSVKIWLLRKIGEYTGIFKDFEGWQQDRSLQNSLKTNDNLIKSIEDVGITICSNPIVRIEGQSGIGKSRQLLEAIKKHKEIQNLVLYTDQVTSRFEDICQDVDAIIRDKQKAFIILDDCPYDKFITIRNMLNKTPNEINFISLDYETESNTNNKSLIPYERINLSPIDNEVIRDILIDQQGYTDENNLYRLIELCGKNPRMAIILSMYTSELDFSSCIEADTLDRMIKTHRKDETSENLSKVLEVCSLFKTIYYTPDNDNELLQIASLAELSESKAIQCFNKLKCNLRVIQTRYEYHYVVPKVLAFQMILSWLKNAPSTLKNQLKVLPDRMKRSCYEQLECLNQYPEVRALAERLLVPFAEREMLNSKFGSECFLRLSNIVPDIALRKLQETFFGFSQDDYLQIKEGRRAIVSSLQIIAFHKEHFIDAAKIMLALADAENESWGNNATGEFIGFFKLYLGGTTCPALNRLPIIKTTLFEGNDNKIKICLKALDRALALGHFVRSSGPETQGTIKLEDWKPETIGDIQAYINAVLDILQGLILDTSFPYRQEAKDIIGQNLRWILQYRNIDEILAHLTRLVEFDNGGWDKTRIALNHFHEFDETKGFTADEIKKIRKFGDILSPRTLAEQVRLYILSKVSWNFYHSNLNDEEIVDKYVHLLLDDYETLNLLLPDLNETDNYHVFLLGKKLAECLSEDKIKQLINDSVSHLLITQKTKLLSGCSFLSGMLNSVDDNLVDEYIKIWSLNKETAIFVLILSRILKHSTFRFNQLIKVIDEYDWDEYLYFYMPLIGKKSYTNEYDDVFNLVASLQKKSNKGSLEAIIQIFHRIFLANQEIPEPLKRIASNIINNWDALKQLDNSGLYTHEYKELWRYFYDTFSNDEKYNVLSQILQHLVDKDETETFLKYHVSDMIKELLAKQDIIVLQSIFDFCSRNNYNFIYFNIYLSDNFEGKENSYIDKFGWDILKSFMDKSKEFRLFVAKNTALFEDNSIGSNFKTILENYIDDEEMMAELRGNIYNFSWTGNVSDYYTKVKNFLIPLSKHSNIHIREWICDTIKTLEDDIKREQKKEELLKFGIY